MSWDNAVLQCERAFADLGPSIINSIEHAFANFDNAIADTVPERGKFQIEIAGNGFVNEPMPWHDFLRRCWKLYGTGRTEPDE